MKRNRLLILSVISGVLLALPWLENFSGIILLIAFVPLLFVEDYLYINMNRNRPYKVLVFSFLSFLLWNLISTFWIGKISVVGAAIVIIFNAFLMALLFFLFHLTKRNLGRNFGNFSLLVYWIGWEYFFMNAEITYPWLNLGNGFAKDISLVQWYEFSGILGGTLWVLAVNLTLFGILKFYIVHKSFRYQLTRIFFFLILVFFPVTVSVIAFTKYETKGTELKAGVIQPNIDPYKEKFSGMDHDEQIDIIMKLADSVAQDNVDYIVGPETVVDQINLNQLEEADIVERMNSFVYKNPGIHFIIGIDGKKIYGEGEEVPPTANQLPKNGKYFDVFNSAIQIDTSGNIPVYHKSKLVSGVEKMPYPRFFKFLNNFIIDIGGVTGSRGYQDDREVFLSTDNQFSVAPVICYESVFGEYVTDYINKGANLIFIITNDGWLRSPGYMQHLHFARLRAIETRRSIARSANTGISCFINQKGEIVQSTDWWTKDAINATIHANNNKTFYVEHGDLLGRVAGFLAIFALLYLIAKMLMRSTENKDILKLRGG
jgi:apolipoprotein N-acyltransferase